MACFPQKRYGLCELVGMPRPAPPFGPPMYTDYQVMADQLVDADLVAGLLKDSPDDWVGVVEVRMLERSCEVGSDCSGYAVTRYSYYFKRADAGNWILFRWAQSDPNTLTCMDTPDSAYGRVSCRRYIGEWVMPWVHEQDYDEFEY